MNTIDLTDFEHTTNTTEAETIAYSENNVKITSARKVNSLSQFFLHFTGFIMYTEWLLKMCMATTWLVPWPFLSSGEKCTLD